MQQLQAQPPTSRRNQPVSEEHEDLVGARVMRGRDWNWGDQDGDPPGPGTIQSHAESTGWVTVVWDSGGQNNYRAGEDHRYDLIYLDDGGAQGDARTRLAMQGWLKVRPGGAGSAQVVTQVASACCCFACGRELATSATQSQEAFTKVSLETELQPGDQLLVAATLQRVVHERRLKEPDMLLCRFPDASSRSVESKAAETDDEDIDLYAFRPCDLVQPRTAARRGSTLLPSEEVCSYNGVAQSRREMVLLLGDAEKARAEWNKAKVEAGESSESTAAMFASCVRGHYFHARCFQGFLIAGKSCPACQEALFVPGVQRTGQNEEDDCCGCTAEPAEAEQALRAAEEFGQQAGSMIGLETSAINGHTLKMCPACNAGPLFNENCSDLAGHHGECPRCRSKPYSSSHISAAIARAGGNVGAAIPVCQDCNVPVMFNGCHACGHIFTGLSWNKLPDWDPKAKVEMELNERYVRTIRILATQVRGEAAYLEHERRALAEARERRMPKLDFDEAPPSQATKLQDLSTSTSRIR